MTETPVDPELIKRTIHSLSQKKHLLSEEALKAKEGYEQVKEEVQSYLTSVPKSPKKSRSIREFNASVKIMANIFQQSKFDQFVYFLSHPIRVFLFSFFQGLFLGLGFVVGLLLLGVLFIVLLKNQSSSISNFLHLIK